MKLFKYRNESEKKKIFKWLQQMSEIDPGVDQMVSAIGQLVKKDGDKALKKLTMLSDPSISKAVQKGGVKSLLSCYRPFKPPVFELRVSAKEMNAAMKQVAPSVLLALTKARDNIARFHEAQGQKSWKKVLGKGKDKVTLGQVYRPVQTAGLYVPGGSAPLVSTVLMTAIPALAAGVPHRFICTPADRQGQVNPLILAAAKMCGVDELYRVGGAQAVFAMAYGTKTIPAVDRISGPGNAYVAAALRQVQAITGVESIPGPSEVMIVADERADPRALALDLCSQAEHDEKAVAVLVSLSKKLTGKVLAALKQVQGELSRSGVIQRSLEKRGAMVEAGSWAQALDLVDRMAPEHLEVNLKGNKSFAFADRVKNAGAILIGPYTPAAVSDYYAGPSHVLPTGGTARFASGVTTGTFLKKTSVVSYEQGALSKASSYIQTLAKVEGLTAHARSINDRVRPKE